MTKALIPILIALFILLLTSCGRSQDVSDDALGELYPPFEVTTDYYDTYMYQDACNALPEMDYQLETLDNHRVLTIGGVFIPGNIRRVVAEFNIVSETYSIEIIDYIDENATWEYWAEGFMRLQSELMTGEGPDIIYDHFGWMTNHEVLFDLYPFIDADSVLSRSDFFPNLLYALESPVSTLPMIANSFNINTMVSTERTAGHIQSWTPSALLKLVEDNRRIREPFGRQIDREQFINQVLWYAGFDFIDWDNHTANLDSDDFINLLNAARLLPEPLTPEEVFLLPYPGDPELSLLQRNQLLEYVFDFCPSSYNIYANVLGNVVVLGFPTSTGGVNILEQTWQMGINAASPHSDIAWEFLRSFMLPTAEIEMFRFPLRIDIFNNLIDTLKIQHIEIDSDGNTVERPIELVLYREGGRRPRVFEIHAITDDVVDRVLHIIDTAVLNRQNVNQQALFSLVDEDIASFFAREKSAEDTARIIQNRVQAFLNEQQP